MGCFDEAKAFSQKPSVLILIQCATIVVAIVSISLVWAAYNELNAAISDVSDLLENWETEPIVAMTQVAWDEDCPSGWEEMPYTTWPGASAGHCACPSTSGSYDSSTSSCNTNQTNAGCLTDYAVSSVDLVSWRGHKGCVLRGGDPAMVWDDSYWERPHPDEDTGECESGYKLCGDSSDPGFDSSRAVCFPEGTPCPLTFVEGGTGSQPDWWSAAAHGNSTGADDEGYRLWYERQGAGDLPLVELALRLKESSSRGVCYQGSNQKYGTAGWSSGAYLGYPGACTRVDTRYEAFDEHSEYDFLVENFLLQSECSGYNSSTIADSDYRTSGIACSGSDCEVTASFGSCRSTDTICKNVIYQSKCGKLYHFAKQSIGSSKTWARYFRSQIYWAESCRVDEDSIEENENPLVKARAAQYWLAVVNTLVNIIIGFIIPFMVIMNVSGKDLPCIPGKGEYERKILKVFKTYLGHIFRLIKFIPLIIAIAIINKITGYFAIIGAVGCSDSMTNYTFSYLAEKLPSVMEKNFGTLGLDVFQIVVFLLLALKERISGKSSNKVGPEGEENDEAGKQEKEGGEEED